MDRAPSQTFARPVRHGFRAGSFTCPGIHAVNIVSEEIPSVRVMAPRPAVPGVFQVPGGRGGPDPAEEYQNLCLQKRFQPAWPHPVRGACRKDPDVPFLPGQEGRRWSGEGLLRPSGYGRLKGGRTGKTQTRLIFPADRWVIRR